VAKKKQDEKKIKVEKITKNLRCDLSEKDVAERSDRVAHLIAKKETKEEELKLQQKQAKNEIGMVEAEIAHLASEVRDRATYRDIECERQYRISEGKVVDVRLDTNEVVFERALMAAELQGELPFPGDVDDEFGGGDDSEEDAAE